MGAVAWIVALLGRAGRGRVRWLTPSRLSRGGLRGVGSAMGGVVWIVALLGRAGMNRPACTTHSRERGARATRGRVRTTNAAVLSLSIACCCPLAAEPVVITGRAMGTTWSAKFIQPPAQLVPGSVVSAIAARLEQLETIFSTFRPQSELSRFNGSRQTDWFPVSAEMAEVASASRRVSELTGGAYDVTVHPLVQLWGFSSQRRSGSLPLADEIVATRVLVGWQNIQVRFDSPALRKTSPRTTADFSSMAKGFAVDAMSDLLARLGAADHVVQLGGDVRTRGAAPGSGGWRLAIEQPAEHASSVASTVCLNGQALSTSGNHRNFFNSGQRQYGHIIDPRSGEPVSSALASVSVIHASCAMSSALATALFVLGPDEGFRLAERQRLACLFQVRTGDTLVARATAEFDRWRE
jgi:thiamine biosynthesis lipoprotein